MDLDVTKEGLEAGIWKSRGSRNGTGIIPERFSVDFSNSKSPDYCSVRQSSIYAMSRKSFTEPTILKTPQALRA